MTRRILVPEVVQTSAVDCGPACLSALLAGFGLPGSYGRLREACQTSVDGTSIDTMEQLANQLGLEAEQIVLPPDHVALGEAAALPAIAVVRLPNGFTHFIVLWRTVGKRVQVMDPLVGRRWSTVEAISKELFIHEMTVPAEGWRKWAATNEFGDALRRRMTNLGLSKDKAAYLLGLAMAEKTWRAAATLDAAVRMFQSLARKQAFSSSAQIERLLTSTFRRAVENPEAVEKCIPAEYWTVRKSAEDTVAFRGAVLVRAKGLSSQPAANDVLPPEIQAAVRERPPSAARTVWQLLRRDGAWTPGVVAGSLLFAAAGVVLQALLFRALISGGHELAARGQRLVGVLAILALLGILLATEYLSISALIGMGRRLEARFRELFFEKLPKIAEPYFQSRLTSDMAERSHNIHNLRVLPALGGQLFYSGFQLILTAAAVIWIDPALWPLVLLAVVSAVGLPLGIQPWLGEKELRVRTHMGALSRFYLDSLLGLAPIRTHVADAAVRAEHRGLLDRWAEASFSTQRAVVAANAVQMLAGFGLAGALVVMHVAHHPDSAAVLLLAYWGLNIPSIGSDLANMACQYPLYRNVALRVLEPLSAIEEQRESQPEEFGVAPISRAAVIEQWGARISMDGVTAQAGGHALVHDIMLQIAPGSHIAIVGRSGAGKSTLAGLLLGWRKPSSGALHVDGQELSGTHLEKLRRHTAWIDPTVQIWNRSLLDNLRFGLTGSSALSMADVLERVDFTGMLEKLPDGLQTILGEGGALVSGGEGQRVRVGRALPRPGIRLAVLDEPFRGLDAETRRALLRTVRQVWRDATVLWITHDLAEAQGMDRVLLMDGGRIVEDGSPAELLRQPDSRYRAMVAEEAEMKRRWFGSAEWRRLEMDDGLLSEETATPQADQERIA
ncbi:MAG TPA: ATP-binding cassette domain-containing protein [Bryobacteraceae bacterium]|nr:ATP-binding cassette domain-containing protein [Bryobacteraceae bacterium]